MAGHVSLAYRGLSELPRDCVAKLEEVHHLDLSHNEFSYPQPLNPQPQFNIVQGVVTAICTVLTHTHT